MPSALNVRVMYEKAPEILMLMERIGTFQPVIVSMLENQPEFFYIAIDSSFITHIISLEISKYVFSQSQICASKG